jgi:methylated-DNA-[protein]-cysteine S-methyltransferase
VRVTRHPYDVPGWGVGEIWACDGTIVQHVLASEALNLERDEGDAALAIPRSAAVVSPTGTGPANIAAATSFTPDGGATLPARTLPAESSRDRADSVSDLCRRVTAHLAGIPTTYDGIPIDLEWATALQRELAAAARSVPWGEVVSYGELAALAGRPRAARAAGSFCAENRFSLVIPCHRVVAANGIGGYGSAGPELKRRLLALEGVSL